MKLDYDKAYAAFYAKMAYMPKYQARLLEYLRENWPRAYAMVMEKK